MAILFFRETEDVLGWMGERIEKDMETHKSDCINYRGDLKHGEECGERDGREYRIWWLVRKDGAQIGTSFEMLAMCVNQYVKEFKHPDFTVYAISYVHGEETPWSVTW